MNKNKLYQNTYVGNPHMIDQAYIQKANIYKKVTYVAIPTIFLLIITLITYVASSHI